MKKLPLIVGAAAALGAVGYVVGRHRLDTKDFEKKLRAWAEDKIGPVDEVDCPDVKMKKGATFTCKVGFTGDQTYDLAVEQVDADGLMRYHWTKPIVAAPRLEKLIADGVKTQTGKDVIVHCGKGIVEIASAGLRCDASAGALTGHVLVHADPASDQITWDQVP